MSPTQANTLHRQRARVLRLVSIARDTQKKRDQVNAGWALNILNRMEQEAA